MREGWNKLEPKIEIGKSRSKSRAMSGKAETIIIPKECRMSTEQAKRE